MIGTVQIDGNPAAARWPSSVVGETLDWEAGVGVITCEPFIHGGSRGQITIEVDRLDDSPGVAEASIELTLADVRTLASFFAGLAAEMEGAEDEDEGWNDSSSPDFDPERVVALYDSPALEDTTADELLALDAEAFDIGGEGGNA